MTLFRKIRPITIIGRWLLYALSLFPVIGPAQIKYPGYSKSAPKDSLSNRLSNQYMPVLGVWVWGAKELQPDGYKTWIDQASKHSPYNLLIPFLRFPGHEVVDSVIYDQVKCAAIYAVKQHVPLVADLDVRAARRAFQKKYPNELQQMLRLKEVRLLENDSLETSVPSLDLNDHYTGGAITHHIPLSGSLLRVYAYRRTPEEIDPSTIRDITADCRVLCSTKDSVQVRIPGKRNESDSPDEVCVMVAFTHLYPDIFAPHLMSFQRSIIEQYSDIPLAGVCKDEWGFPPYYPRFYRSGMHDFWYSTYRAQSYHDQTGGRDLLSDCLLMALGEKGKEADRQMAINYFMAMSGQRNSKLEEDYYHTVKKVFGPDAAVTVHSTWWPFPDRNEYKKNGLDWWTAKRDWAQTDELTPFAVRTALCKKWGSSIWYNMYYKEDLATQLWSSALAGGRINFLPFQSLFNPDLMRAENRIRLLDYISKSPLDCPVAVIFGKACTMNWAGPHFDDTGMALVDSLWRRGYPTDLIPASEIENGNLRIDSAGSVCYGKQRYATVILYHPEFEKKATATFFNQVKKGKTLLFRIGHWTRNFNGQAINGDRLLPRSMIAADTTSQIFPKIIEALTKQNIQRQTPATGILDNRYFKLRDFNHTSCSPATTGYCRLIDGTVIHIAGTRQVSGDTIRTSFKINRFEVSVDAVGVAAIRLDENGKVKALAAGSLKQIKSGSFNLKLSKRIDLALWVNEKGQWQGVIQGENQPIPKELLAITKNWTHLLLPAAPSNKPAGKTDKNE